MTQLPPKIDLEIMRGDSKTLTFVIEDDDGAPLDLGTVQVWMTAKRSVLDPDASAVFQLLLGGNITVVGANADGTIAVHIAPSHTNSLPLKVMQLVYDVQVKTEDDDVQTAMYGNLTVHPDVTLAA